MTVAPGRSLGVLTSGGDASGMNAAVRAVVRTALDRGVPVHAILEGYQGMVAGGDLIRPMTWNDVGGILQRGGTVIGTARCDAFRTRPGRLRAARHLVERGIDTLVVIGGDGSLTGADTLRGEWSSLLEDLVNAGEISREVASAYERLTLVGLVGSIDNDMQGTDITIGALTALHRITEAIDALLSTAASHQRTFVVEVMGRHCGYLALMSALATGADWALIPESPPDVQDWEETMCARLEAGRAAGRRASIVVVAEGAVDRDGRPISTAHVKRTLEERLGEDVRETILGHVQRGGRPCAYDRVMGAVVGHAAVDIALSEDAWGEARLVGIREGRVVDGALVEAVAETRRVGKALEACDFETALALRGEFFQESWRTLRTLVRALPHPPVPGRRRLRLGVLNAGAPAPGMNTAVRAAVRLGLDRGHEMLGVRGGVSGLLEGRLVQLDWMSVNGWAGRGGSELGTDRVVPDAEGVSRIAGVIEEAALDGLLVVGGGEGYETAHALLASERVSVPVVCLPASIANDLPGSERSVGGDTALNMVMHAVDAIKQSAVATRRAFVVEVMGGTCGWLALTSGIATGAERVYLHEEGVTLDDLRQDVAHLVAGFEQGKRLGLVIRNERAHEIYDTDFTVALFEEEGGDLFDVRKSILGHLQQGGDPSPFDRILATRLAARCIQWLDAQGLSGGGGGAYVGVQWGEIRMHDLADLPEVWDPEHRRPADPWWLALRPVASLLAQPGPGAGRP